MNKGFAFRRVAVATFAVVLAASGVGTSWLAVAAEEKQEAAPVAKNTWHGFDRYDFVIDEQTLAITPFQAPAGEGDGIADPAKGTRRCVLVVPKEAAPGNPWSWRGCYWNHEPQTEIELLKHGFCIAYISANQVLKPGREWDAWYAYLTEKRGLSPKPGFIGMSRGGQFEYIWATGHPDKVSYIYADNPAVTPESLAKLGELAANDVPLFHVCGSIDPLYPDHSSAVENIYRQFGGRISVMVKEGFGHHPHSLRDPKPIVDFILASVHETRGAAPSFLPEKFRRTSFYGVEDIYENFPSDGAAIAYRGPFFTGSYDRYQFSIPGFEPSVTVIAPKAPAAGNPWVYRVGAVARDSKVDLTLLAKGYHIVTGPAPYNSDGLQLEHWNAVYKYLIEHGFSAKPAMEGSEAPAGEVYAWAIANPDKVSCIFAVNPVFHSRMTKQPLLESLEPLAKAGVPILNICGSADPLLKDNAEALENRYRALGGKVTTSVQQGAGHHQMALTEPQTAVDFVLGNSAK